MITACCNCVRFGNTATAVYSGDCCVIYWLFGNLEGWLGGAYPDEQCKPLPACQAGFLKWHVCTDIAILMAAIAAEHAPTVGNAVQAPIAGHSSRRRCEFQSHCVPHCRIVELCGEAACYSTSHPRRLCIIAVCCGEFR